MGFEALYRPASDLLGNAWINSEPIILHEVEGKSVLLHFFDFSSLRSVESLVYAKGWAQQYADCGLITVGVHIPSYTFGKDRSRIESSLRRYSIWYPVVMDNDARIALTYNIRVVPAFCVIDKEKNVRYQLTDDGSTVEFERALRQLLTECGYKNELPPMLCPLRASEDGEFLRVPQTTDVAVGYLRGTIGNVEGVIPEGIVEYHDPQFYVSERCYLHGKWLIGREMLRYVGTSDEEGYLLFPYEGKDIYALLESADGVPCEVVVEQDGYPVSSDSFGNDLIQASDHRSVVTVSEPRLYHLISNQKVTSHLLRLIPINSRVAVYALSSTSTVVVDVVPLN